MNETLFQLIVQVSKVDPIELEFMKETLEELWPMEDSDIRDGTLTMKGTGPLFENESKAHVAKEMAMAIWDIAGEFKEVIVHFIPLEPEVTSVLLDEIDYQCHKEGIRGYPIAQA